MASGPPSETLIKAIEVFGKAFAWVNILIVTALVFNRLFVQFYLIRGFSLRSYIREAVLFVGWLGLFVYVVINYGVFGKEVWQPSFSHFSDDDFVWTMKLGLATQGAASTFFAYKIVLNLIYYDWCLRSVLPAVWWANTVSLVFNVVSWIIFFVLIFFFCVPLSSYWTTDSLKFQTDCTNLLPVNMTQMALHVSSDVIVFTIPFLVISKLKLLSVKKRLEAAFIFIIGSLNVLSCTAVLAIALYQIFGPAPMDYSDPGDGTARVFLGSSQSWSSVSIAGIFLGVSYASTGLMVVCGVQVRVTWRWLKGDLNGGVRKSADVVELGLAERDGGISRPYAIVRGLIRSNVTNTREDKMGPMMTIQSQETNSVESKIE